MMNIKNLLTFILIIISFVRIEAQVIFESSNMELMTDGKTETIKIDHRIIINSDTTEIEIHSKNIHTKEKILSLRTVFNEVSHDVLVYEIENDEILVLYIKEGNIYSILFQSDMNNHVMFNF